MRKFFIFFIFIIYLNSCGGASVEELGIFGESRKGNILGQDGVTPIPFTDSITIWTFGDTILGSWKGNVSTNATFGESTNIKSMISNSLAFSNNLTLKNIKNLKFVFLKKDGKVCQFLKMHENENPTIDRLWAVDGIRIDNKVYVYYFIIQIEKLKHSSFKKKGVGIAVWDIPEGWEIGDPVSFKRLPDLFPGNWPAFGVSILKKDGYIYTAGQYITEGNTSPIKIARAKISGIKCGRAYEFLGDQGRWVRDINKAKAFLGDVMGECSLSYNEYLKKYVIIYCQLWTGRIIMVTFKNFCELNNRLKEVIYIPQLLVQEKNKKPLWYYSGKEIFSTGDLIFIIYINPEDYQPYLLKINLQFNILNWL